MRQLGRSLRRAYYAGVRVIIMYIRTILTFLLISIASNSYSQEKSTQWSWFVASSVINDWKLEKGIANVHLTQSSFKADLYLENEIRHSIKGKRIGNNITAKLSTAETDQIDYPLSGNYQMRTWKGFSTLGRETITLYWGGIIVGFTREIINEK